MATITIKSPPISIAPALMSMNVKLEEATHLLPSYEVLGSFTSDLDGLSGAREAFDLTNNPSRQDERVERYGRYRSVSVGDIVEVDGVNYFCDNFGWLEL